MASVFVSHSSRDRVVTERVVARLRAAGFAALFVDFDPEQGIPAGCSWDRELHAQLRRTDAVILLASEALSPPGGASLNSAWPDPWPAGVPRWPATGEGEPRGQRRPGVIGWLPVAASGRTAGCTRVGGSTRDGAAVLPVLFAGTGAICWGCGGDGVSCCVGA
jgi:hypothetical protein